MLLIGCPARNVIAILPLLLHASEATNSLVLALRGSRAASARLPILSLQVQQYLAELFVVGTAHG